MLILPILLPLVGGIYLLFHPSKHIKRYCFTVLFLTTLSSVLLQIMSRENTLQVEFPFQVAFLIQIDGITIFFSLVSLLIWWVVLEYALSYLEHDAEKNRFFAFFVAALSPMLGLCYAGNLVTLYLFFELVGLLCIPLVAHEQTEEALRASRKYLYYSVAGAFMGLTTIFYFFSLGIPQTFTAGGVSELTQVGDTESVLAFTLLGVVGFGCKAGLFPLHGWLKSAHPIAPAPASALLSGITTKAGIIAMLRLLYYVVGEEVIRGTYVQTWGLRLSILTIFMGSMLAYREKEIKTRLAYSTVSQVSYIVFALFLFQEYAFLGALLQVLFHASGKTILFLSAGTIIHETGLRKVDEFQGLGKKMPRTFFHFGIASLSLVGLPLTGGFVSKWCIAIGGAGEGELAMTGIVVLILSALLTAGYLLPILVQACFLTKEDKKGYHVPKTMTSPILSIVLLVFGVFPLPLIYFFIEFITKFLEIGIGGGL